MAVQIERFNGYDFVSKIEIEDYEKKIGFSLPTDYREFLLRFNGGVPTPADLKLGDGTSTTIRAFYAVAPFSRDMSLDGQFRRYRGRMPDGYIPIGEDPGGNRICLCLASNHYGQVFFWDHEQESDEDSANRYISFLANTFSGLLDNLYKAQSPADKDEIISYCRAGDAAKVREAIRRGLSPNFKSEQGFSLGCIAAGNDRVEVLRVLLEAGADLEGAISFAARNGKSNSLKYLLGLNLKIDLRDEDDKTPLMNAVIFQYPYCVELLLKSGANIHATWKGRSVEELARGDSRDIVLALIRQQKAQVGNS